jgi:hypothetical protein
MLAQGIIMDTKDLVSQLKLTLPNEFQLIRGKRLQAGRFPPEKYPIDEITMKI